MGVRLSVQQEVALVQLEDDEPAVGGVATNRQLTAIWAALVSSPSVRAIVVASTKDGFAFGSDQNSVDGFGPKAAGIYVPVVAAIGGRVNEFGIDIVAEADIRIASPAAHFQFGPPMAVALKHQALLRLLPYGEIASLALLQRPLPAERAHTRRLIHEIVTDFDLTSRGFDLAVEASEPERFAAMLAALAVE